MNKRDFAVAMTKKTNDAIRFNKKTDKETYRYMKKHPIATGVTLTISEVTFAATMAAIPAVIIGKTAGKLYVKIKNRRAANNPPQPPVPDTTTPDEIIDIEPNNSDAAPQPDPTNDGKKKK